MDEITMLRNIISIIEKNDNVDYRKFFFDVASRYPHVVIELMNDDERKLVLPYIKNGRKIAAVEAHRKEYGSSLKQAHDFVDRVAREEPTRESLGLPTTSDFFLDIISKSI